MITLRQLFTITSSDQDFNIKRWSNDLGETKAYDRDDCPESWLDVPIVNINLAHGSVSAWYDIELEEE